MTLFSIAQIDDYVKIFKEGNSDFSGVSFEFSTFAFRAPPEDGWGLKRRDLIVITVRSLLQRCIFVHSCTDPQKNTLTCLRSSIGNYSFD